MNSPGSWPLPHAEVRTDLSGWDRWEWDLAWHRESWEQSRVRWGETDITDIISAYTEGRLEFTTARDLHYLQGIANTINEHTELLLTNIFLHLHRAIALAPGPDPAYSLATAWSISDDLGVLSRIRDRAHRPTNTHSDFVLDGLGPRNNPLIAGWELLQHWHCWDGAHQLVLNTHALLTWELLDEPRRVRTGDSTRIDAALTFLRSWGIKERPDAMPIPTQTYRI